MSSAGLKKMLPEEFFQKSGVSRETFATMRLYNEHLQKWQKAINLVSPKTLEDAWERHFYDSAQLFKFVPKSAKRFVDLGSGAGFPGLVLALMMPEVDFHFIESDERKCQFLKNVSRETERIVFIHNQRIEDALPGLEPDLITARAFASLSKILEISEVSWKRNPDLQFLLLKGKGADQEIEEAKKAYDFQVDMHPSETDSEGKILVISGVSAAQTM